MLGTMQTLVYIALEVEYEEFLRDKKEGLKIYSKFSMKSVKTRKKEEGRKEKKRKKEYQQNSKQIRQERGLWLLKGSSRKRQVKLKRSKKPSQGILGDGKC